MYPDIFNVILLISSVLLILSVFKSIKGNVSDMFPIEVSMDRWAKDVESSVFVSSVLQIITVFFILQWFVHFNIQYL